MADFDLIVDVLQDVFGEWKNHNSHSGQISFDCPTCSFDITVLDKGDWKVNLEMLEFEPKSFESNCRGHLLF